MELLDGLIDAKYVVMCLILIYFKQLPIGTQLI